VGIRGTADTTPSQPSPQTAGQPTSDVTAERPDTAQTSGAAESPGHAHSPGTAETLDTDRSLDAAETPPGPHSPGKPKARRRLGSGRRLFAFDRGLGSRFVAGADEAGRGSLAGPLVAAAVLFDLERLTLSDRRALSRLNDSKQHTADAREELYPLVLRAAARSVIVSRCVRGIDSRGLHNTNLEALRAALLCVARSGTVCLVDGFRVPDFGFEQRAVIDGDCRSAAIAAASVLAKVTRDRYMRRAAQRHPGWDFETNVGYSTPEHRAAIASNGISPIHRLSFQSIAYTQLALDG
jgi:ribonuclease HII